MGYEFFIAKRYLRSKHKLNFITIISVISTLGITIGVAALIVVLSVFNGFGSLVTSILVNFDPHVRITAVSTDAYDQMPKIEHILQNTSHVKTINPFVSGKAIVKKVRDNLLSIVDVKGIDYENKKDAWGVAKSIVLGSYDLRDSDEKEGIIIGFNLADKLQCATNDSLFLTSFNSLSESAISYSMPPVRKYRVNGIFQSNNNEYDRDKVFVSLESAQALFDMQGKIQGFEIRLDDIKNSSDVKKELEAKLDSRYFRINTWYDLHKDLYSVMQIERWAAYIIVSLIIAVAAFNVLGSLAMSVIEKKKDIGVLRSMGAKDKSIIRIFMFEGILIGLIGTFVGSLLGVLIVFLQMQLKFYPLDASKYIIDALPVELRLGDFFAVAGMSLFLSFIASLYPARRALKISALEAIKWE
ncbi:MAG: ABC transporter permease [Bacteroidota bacterium]|nr:ABC transporter permease [Bacteroidota bacterium]MDP4193845.1 ABC transporter permease [Bacteroidota bacterium]